ncbi:MAG: anti-sigma factor family protein [Aeromicrobium sp.]
MAHLGDDVAAFVDGQLPPASMRAVELHLEGCEACRRSVLQQRLLKSRMRGVAPPEPPPGLVASLSTLPHAGPGRSAWWSRLGVGLVLLGASMAVAAVAYVVGPDEDSADEVAPPFDRYAAEFAAVGQRPSGNLTISAMAELDDYGWPCRSRLGGGMERVAGSYRDNRETVSLVYSDGFDSLNLFEQGGSLDPRAVEEFDRRLLAQREVWVRDGRPRVVTWDADGVVFTIVTELGDRRLGQAIADLPRAAGEPDPVERIGDGLNRMTTWISVRS